jgi:hypothetical protein
MLKGENTAQQLTRGNTSSAAIRGLAISLV